MKFTTSFPIPAHSSAISYHSKVVLLGSCFSQNIGDQFKYYGFDVVVNPFRILFNPHSLRVLIEKSLKQDFQEIDVMENYSYLAHSDINGTNASETLDHLKKAGGILNAALKQATHLIITLGTAWVYELKDSKIIVANCHQQPQHLFNKRLLEPQEILKSLQAIKSLVAQMNPELEILWTLSPVRHIKDGMVENTRSKSRLHEALQQHCDQSKDYYFPAYEIMMDELRDYRFYAGDMIHPSATAVDYVWLRFRESVLSKDIIAPMKMAEKYRKLAAHRPKDIATHEVQLSKLKEEIQNSHPEIQL